MLQPELNRQTRKRLLTRQKISDVATRLFIVHGFDHVTIDEIADAADVSRMTVFNHFPRKEDMFFDLNDEAVRDLLAALSQRAPHTSPIEALRLFAHWSVAQRRPYALFCEPGSERFMATIAASETLKARARAIGDEMTDTLTHALAHATKRPVREAAARLAAALLISTWTVAVAESHRAYQQHQDARKAYRVFLQLIDQGTKGVNAAFEGTPLA